MTDKWENVLAKFYGQKYSTLRTMIRNMETTILEKDTKIDFKYCRKLE